MKIRLLIPILLFFAACGKDEDPEPVESIRYSFIDGFESNGDIFSLLPSDGTGWSTLDISGAEGVNEVSLCDTLMHDGQQSLRVFAQRTGAVVSKAFIEKNDFRAPEGSKVVIEASVYLNSTAVLQDLTLMNLESCDAWDPAVPGNNCPGIRLILKGDGNYLSIDREKILCSTIGQSAVAFPQKQWVKIYWEMVLSSEDQGMNRILIDGQEVLFAAAANLPSPALFAEAAADDGTAFTMQQPVYYQRVQLGVTANPGANEVEVFFDNFRISVTR